MVSFLFLRPPPFRAASTYLAIGMSAVFFAGFQHAASEIMVTEVADRSGAFGEPHEGWQPSVMATVLHGPVLPAPVSAAPAAQLQYATLHYTDNCGFADSGSDVYLVNQLSDRQVRVTVRITRRDRGVIDPVHSNSTYTLSAGGRRKIGCTRGGWIASPSYSYLIMGVEVVASEGAEP